MEVITAAIRLVGIFGLVGLIIYVAYLFYEKNQTISVILLISGLILAIYLIASEIEFKRKRHDAPWQYEKYKGE